jgi:hypothetical protein
VRAATFAAALTLVMTAPAAGEPAIVVPADDTRTHAVASRRLLSSAIWYANLPEDANALWYQLGVGPVSWKLPFRGSSMGELDRWTLRARFGVVANRDDKLHWAPLTFAAQRISVHDTLSVLPLIHVQTGIEVAFSTPWVSGKTLDPRMLGADVYSADTELARNGWSIRPAEWHVRADALMCRSIHVEAGLGPELFRSTEEPDRGLDFGLRWRASLGMSLACPARTSWFITHVTASVQYRARALLYNRDAPSAYDDRLAFALQYQYGPLSVAGFITPDAKLWGVRVEVDAGGPSR